jgi:signal transduction histidine kinase
VHQLIRTTSGISDATLGTRLELPPRRDELFDLTQTINALLSRIEISLVKQKQFTSDASHEIRTPLAAIRGTLEVLGRKTRDPEVYQEKIKEVIQQVDRLDALLDQLLQLARMESGATPAHIENIDLHQLLQSLQVHFNTAALESQITLDIQVETHTMVRADKLLLEIMLDNLISNAIKYGKHQGHVHLTWKPSTHTLLVSDDGLGIPAEHLPHIFDRFYRADVSRSSAVKGIGIGLSIVKKLADLQNIHIAAESKEGAGSTFSLVFPA